MNELSNEIMRNIGNLVEFFVDGALVVDELLVLDGHLLLDALLDGLFRVGDLLLVVSFDFAQFPFEIVEQLRLSRPVLHQPPFQLALLFQRLFQRLPYTTVSSY